MIRAAASVLIASIMVSGCSSSASLPSPSAVVGPPVTSEPDPSSTAAADPTSVPVADPRASRVTAATLATRAQDGPAYIQSYLGVYPLPDLLPNSAASFDDAPLLSIGYVLSGTVRWSWDDRSVDVHAGEAAATPPKTFHQSNPGSTTTRWYTFIVYGGSRTAFGALRRIVQGPQLRWPHPKAPSPSRPISPPSDPNGGPPPAPHAAAVC